MDGDFTVHEDELQGVLKALRKGDINIVAIHNHMTDETPRTLFLHYLGNPCSFASTPVTLPNETNQFDLLENAELKHFSLQFNFDRL